MRQTILLMSALILTACQPKSEIDKCTEALVKINKTYKDDEERNFYEAQARLMCMREQARKE